MFSTQRVYFLAKNYKLLLLSKMKEKTFTGELIIPRYSFFTRIMIV